MTMTSIVARVIRTVDGQRLTRNVELPMPPAVGHHLVVGPGVRVQITEITMAPYMGFNPGVSLPLVELVLAPEDGDPAPAIAAGWLEQG